MERDRGLRMRKCVSELGHSAVSVYGLSLFEYGCSRECDSHATGHCYSWTAFVAVSLCPCHLSQHLGLVLSLWYLVSVNQTASVSVNWPHDGSNQFAVNPSFSRSDMSTKGRDDKLTITCMEKDLANYCCVDKVDATAFLLQVSMWDHATLFKILELIF